ncbi:MAG: hypothetical protein FJ090_01565 [Deltaproteobacteria bacterium]|nr:hypothetical protein [Deltaproteobacteria bacterium]
MGGALDTAIDCGTPYTADTGEEGVGGAGGHDHGAPENQPYDIDDFDLPENCAQCHPTHYDQWQGSIHAYAATNPVMWVGSQRIGELTESPFNCVGCHAPAATRGVLFAEQIFPEGNCTSPVIAKYREQWLFFCAVDYRTYRGSTEHYEARAQAGDISRK